MGKITLSKKVESVNSAVAQKVLFDLVVNSNLRKIRKYSELEKYTSTISSTTNKNKALYMETENALGKLSAKKSTNWIKLA